MATNACLSRTVRQMSRPAKRSVPQSPGNVKTPQRQSGRRRLSGGHETGLDMGMIPAVNKRGDRGPGSPRASGGPYFPMHHRWPRPLTYIRDPLSTGLERKLSSLFLATSSYVRPGLRTSVVPSSDDTKM